MNLRRLLRGLAVAVVALAVLVVAMVIALPGIVRWVAVRQLGAATGRTVALDAVELSLFRGRLALRGLRVIDRDGAPLATLERAEVRFSPRDLLRGHGRITDATVQALTIRIVRTGPREFNISDLLARRTTGGGAAPSLTIEQFALAAAVVIEDRTLTPPRTWRAQAELQARDASTVAGSPPGAATLNAVVAGSPISLVLSDLRLAPLHVRATLTARDIDASLAALYVPPDSPLRPARGKVSVSATIDHDASSGTLVALEASFADVELQRPGEERAYLTAPAMRVTVEGLRVRPGGIELARLAVDGGALVVEDTRLGPVRRWQIDGVALEARNLSSARAAPPGVATARAATSGAKVEVWVTNVRLAPLELAATTIIRNVDLALMRLYLPPELPIHPERGVVNATVRVEHDERRGTRLGLDAGLSNIELRRPAHFVTAPAVRITVDDIALDRGAVSIGHVSVTGDRLTLEERTVTPVRTWPVQNLKIEAKDLSSRRDAVQGVASLQATVAGAASSIYVTQARLEPLELHATTVLRNADAALFQQYLPAGVPVELIRGLVNATFQIDHSQAGGTRLTGDATFTNLQARGRGVFGTLTAAAPSLRMALVDGRRLNETLSVGRVELTGSGLFTDSRGSTARFDLTQLRLATADLTWPVKAPARVEVSMRFQDRGELDGSGTARLTAPLPTIAWVAELALKFRGVDLSPLSAYVPAASGFGGRVRADVTANLAYAGALTARVRGDVGGARFALAEGAKTLVSLRSIDAKDLDVQWPERIAIKQLRLRQPYALVERDPQGAFPLAARFAARPPAAASPSPAAVSPPPASVSPPGAALTKRSALGAISVDEIIVEKGSAALVDQGFSPPLRADLPRVDLTIRNATWPASTQAQILLDVALPAGGTLKAEGTATAPTTIDLTLALKNGDLASARPYMGFRAGLGGRLDANLKVAGSLSPTSRLRIAGDVDFRSLDISDGERSVLTTERLSVTGIDATWPERVVVGGVRARRAWALIERDQQGRFLLRTLLERPTGAGIPRPSSSTPSPSSSAATPSSSPATSSSAAPAAPAGSAVELILREGIFEEQGATIIDGTTTPPARMEVNGARLAVRDFTWPSRTPAKIEVTSPMPAGGRLDVSGTIQLEPMRLEARATLDGVAIEPAQPYLPIEGRVAGKVTGDLTVKLALEPTSIQVAGQARLRAFRLSDGDRPVVTVGRIDTAGIDVDWPRRIMLKSVQVRRPSLLVERDAKGAFRLRQLMTPRWGAATQAASPPDGSPASASSPSRSPARASTPTPAQAPTIEVATLSLEKALARFVDHTTRPAYAEELEDVNVTFTPLTTAPGRRTRFAADGGIGGGTFKLAGEGAYGEHPVFELKLDLRDFIMARANPYLVRYTAWTATNGSLSITGTYKLEGTNLETRHDLLVRGLQVAPVDERDEVERRIGLPFGLLVSLLKDSRGEIRLALPVAGDLRTREFDYHESVWGAVRNLSIRLLALPFSKIGSLFFSQDSKVKAVALGPVVFEPGTDRLGPAMGPHLQRVTDFLRGAPSVKVVLEPIVIESDVLALKQALAAGQTSPPDALRTLAARRIEVVRQGLTQGGVDGGRLSGTARRAALVEATGDPRVEFDLRP